MKFMNREGLSFPVVLKLDAGVRGRGVSIVHSPQELASYLEATVADVIIQEYVSGPDFGCSICVIRTRLRAASSRSARSMFPT
jgi:glutathione synthase/RimK-type ligase-like ATP-grasp enzyme